jgi:hypothetical protein
MGGGGARPRAATIMMITILADHQEKRERTPKHLSASQVMLVVGGADNVTISPICQPTMLSPSLPATATMLPPTI